MHVFSPFIYIFRLVKLPYLQHMYQSSFDLIDRLSAKSVLRPHTSSICGMMGTFILIGVMFWLFIPTISFYLAGMYYQSMFQVQQTPYYSMNIPHDLKTALVFYNKTNNQIANHTLLLQTMNVQAFKASGAGNTLKIGSVEACNPNYFANAVNPITLTDCFIFPSNSQIDISYYASTGSVTFGFTTSIICSDPFNCYSGKTSYTNAQNAVSSLFNNYTYTLYFTSRIIMPDSTFRDQLYSIYSSQFNTPFTIASDTITQLQTLNTTIDTSIFPWTNTQTYTAPAWYGVLSSSPKNSTAVYSPAPKADFTNSKYQNIAYRYYKKADWLLGMIGGTMFLLFIIVYIPCHYINETISHMRLANEMLIQHPVIFTTISSNDLKPVNVSWCYFLQRLIPKVLYQNQQIKEVKRVFDITNIIKMLRVAERNLDKHNIPQYTRRRVLQIQLETHEQERAIFLPEQSIAHVPNLDHPEEPNIFSEQIQPPQRQMEMLERQIQRPRTRQIQREEQRQQFQQQNGRENNQQQRQQQKQQQKIQKPTQQKQQQKQPFDYKLQNQNNKSRQQIPQGKWVQMNQRVQDKHIQTVILSPHRPKPRQDFTEFPEQRSIRNSNQPPTENAMNEILPVEANPQEISNPQYQITAQNQIMPQNLIQPQTQQHLSEQIENRNQLQPVQEIVIIERIIFQRTRQQQSQVLNMHQQTIQLIKSQRIASDMLTPNPTVYALRQNNDQYIEAIQVYKYDHNPKTPKINKFKTILNQIVECLRFFDIFGVKPQLYLSPADSSIFGCLVGLFIASLSILFFISTLLQANNVQVFVSKDFQIPQQVQYTLTTGPGFRPFVCGSSTVQSKLVMANPNVTLTFFSNSPNGRVTIPMYNLKANQQEFLGISTDSQYYNTISTNNCFVMYDNYSVPMGGFGTPHEAYFGFRIDPYCSGTAAYCQSISATLSANFFNFINSFGLTLYLPVNAYNQNSNSISSGGIYAQPIRQGSTSFTTYSAVQETMYVDQIKLLDRYSLRFVGTPPPILQQFITSGRYQPEPRVEGFVVSLPYYEVRVRPSGKVTNVYLNGYTIDLLFAIIGGISLIFYALFHCIAKSYNHFNVRAWLLKVLYSEQLYFKNFFYKLLIMIPVPTCLFFERFSDEIKRDRKLDNIIKQDLNQIELVKQIITIFNISTAEFDSKTKKLLSQAYIKPQIANPNNTVPHNTPQDNQFLDFDENTAFEMSSHNSSNQIINLDQNLSGIQHRSEQQSQQPDYLLRNQQLERRVREQKQKQDPIIPYNRHKGPSSHQPFCFSHYLDWFSCKPQFSLQGKWRVQSVFGSLVFFGLIACIYSMGAYQLNSFINNSNQTINYQKTMIADTTNEPGLILNHTNYGCVLGFYVKPNTTFLDVSYLVNTTSTVIIVASQITVIRDITTGLITQTEVMNQMVPCTSDYFKNYQDNNTDNSFLSSVKYGWCLPKNLTLNITPTSARTVTQYVTFKVTSKANDTTTLNNLKTLTGNYVIGLLMTVPVIDLANQQFRSSVQQIRGYLNPATRTMSYNITLTKQQITFTTPSYSLNPPQTTLTTYNYLDNKNNEFQYASASNTSLPRNYNISLTYEGLLEHHVVQNPHIIEVFGIIGGLIILFYFVAICFVEPFNKYIMRYQVGKELYLIPRRPNNQEPQRSSPGEAVQCNELQLLGCWLFSTFLCQNTLYQKVTQLQELADKDLNINNFYQTYRNLKDRINNKYQWNNFPDIKSTSLFTKLPYIPVSPQHYDLEHGQTQFLFKHSLSSYQHQIIRRAINQYVIFQDVFDDPAITEHLFHHRQQPQQAARNAPLAEDINIELQQGELEPAPGEQAHGEPVVPSNAEKQPAQANNIEAPVQPPPEKNINQTFEMINNDDQQFP